MVDRQAEELSRLELPFRGLFGRPLHGIDCQGLFCELDKYCREAVPELTSARTRIKAKYKGSSEGMALFFPPKWGLCAPGTLPAATQRAGLSGDATHREPGPARARRRDFAMADLFDGSLD